MTSAQGEHAFATTRTIANEEVTKKWQMPGTVDDQGVWSMGKGSFGRAVIGQLRQPVLALKLPVFKMCQLFILALLRMPRPLPFLPIHLRFNPCSALRQTPGHLQAAA